MSLCRSSPQRAAGMRLVLLLWLLVVVMVLATTTMATAQVNNGNSDDVASNQQQQAQEEADTANVCPDDTSQLHKDELQDVYKSWRLCQAQYMAIETRESMLQEEKLDLETQNTGLQNTIKRLKDQVIQLQQQEKESENNNELQQNCQYQQQWEHEKSVFMRDANYEKIHQLRIELQHVKHQLDIAKQTLLELHDDRKQYDINVQNELDQLNTQLSQVKKERDTNVRTNRNLYKQLLQLQSQSQQQDAPMDDSAKTEELLNVQMELYIVKQTLLEQHVARRELDQEIQLELQHLQSQLGQVTNERDTNIQRSKNLYKQLLQLQSEQKKKERGQQDDDVKNELYNVRQELFHANEKMRSRELFYKRIVDMFAIPKDVYVRHLHPHVTRGLTSISETFGTTTSLGAGATNRGSSGVSFEKEVSSSYQDNTVRTVLVDTKQQLQHAVDKLGNWLQPYWDQCVMLYETHIPESFRNFISKFAAQLQTWHSTMIAVLADIVWICTDYLLVKCRQYTQLSPSTSWFVQGILILHSNTRSFVQYIEILFGIIMIIWIVIRRRHRQNNNKKTAACSSIKKVPSSL